MTQLKIIRPNIFNSKQNSASSQMLIAGVIEANYSVDMQKGFSTKYDKYYSEEEISENRTLFQSLHPKHHIIYQTQAHSDIIREITNNTSNELSNEEMSESESDVLITQNKSVILCVHVADCGGILIYDRVNNAIASIHSGWQGTKQNIIGKTISQLKDKYNSHAENLLVYISPCAGVESYEVGSEFKNYFPNSVRESNGKLYFNNKKEMKSQLSAAGVKEENIEISELCTIESKGLHSFRRDGNKSGRMTVFIGLK